MRNSVPVRAALLLLVVACRCAAPPRYPTHLVRQGILVPGQSRPWSDPFVWKGRHCSVRTTLGPLVAEHLGKLLDAEFDHLAAAFAAPAPVGVRVIGYASVREFRRLASSGHPGPRTRGYFLANTSEIHLVLTEEAGYGPQAVLLHEGAHAYLQCCFDFPVPPGLRRAVGRRRLRSVPWWFQEGLATTFESARLLEGKLRTGRVNSGRLRELRRVLALRRGPHLPRLLRTGYARRHGSADYALAWGLVYWLLHCGSPADRARHRAALGRYLQECRRGFFADPVRGFAARFAPAGQLCQDFDERWAAWRARNALRLFQALIVGPATTLSDWEDRWVEGLGSLGDSEVAKPTLAIYLPQARRSAPSAINQPRQPPRRKASVAWSR